MMRMIRSVVLSICTSLWPNPRRVVSVLRAALHGACGKSRPVRLPGAKALPSCEIRDPDVSTELEESSGECSRVSTRRVMNETREHDLLHARHAFADAFIDQFIVHV